jgi:hypothetical protein
MLNVFLVPLGCHNSVDFGELKDWKTAQGADFQFFNLKSREG